VQQKLALALGPTGVPCRTRENRRDALELFQGGVAHLHKVRRKERARQLLQRGAPVLSITKDAQPTTRVGEDPHQRENLVVETHRASALADVPHDLVERFDAHGTGEEGLPRWEGGIRRPFGEREHSPERMAPNPRESTESWGSEGGRNLQQHRTQVLHRRARAVGQRVSHEARVQLDDL